MAGAFGAIRAGRLRRGAKSGEIPALVRNGNPRFRRWGSPVDDSCGAGSDLDDKDGHGTHRALPPSQVPRHR